VALVREHHTAEQEDFDVVVRVGLDTIPEVRRAALLSLVQIGGAGSLPEIREGIGRSQSESTTRRALEELVVLGVLSEKKTARQTEYQIVSPAHLNILTNFLRAFLGDGEVGTSDATR
jgi:hypothetical protein